MELSNTPMPSARFPGTQKSSNLGSMTIFSLRFFIWFLTEFWIVLGYFMIFFPRSFPSLLQIWMLFRQVFPRFLYPDIIQVMEIPEFQLPKSRVFSTAMVSPGRQGGGGVAPQQRQGQRLPGGAAAEGGGGSSASGAESLAEPGAEGGSSGKSKWKIWMMNGWLIVMNSDE